MKKEVVGKMAKVKAAHSSSHAITSIIWLILAEPNALPLKSFSRKQISVYSGGG
jgi:hypothetical protein